MLRTGLVALAAVLLVLPAAAQQHGPGDGAAIAPPAINAHMAEADLARTLDAWFAALNRDGRFDGSVPIAHGDGVWTVIILANREPPTAEAADQAAFPLLAGPPPA